MRSIKHYHEYTNKFNRRELNKHYDPIKIKEKRKW